MVLNGHDGSDRSGESARRDLPGAPKRKARPNTAPAYYLGCSARLWINVMRPHRSSGSRHPIPAVTWARQAPPRHGDPIRESARAQHGTNDGPSTPASARDTIRLVWAVHDQWPWGGQR
jgi:hypothetical protein